MNVNIDCPKCKMSVSVEIHSAFPLDEGYNDFLEKCPECDEEVHIELVAQVSAEQSVHSDAGDSAR